MSKEPITGRILDVKNPLKLFLTVTAIATVVIFSSEPLFARGGVPNIMDSPGYQRRLQESRQQLSQPDVQSSSTYRRKWRHRHRH
jgi:hypothetical protein